MPTLEIAITAWQWSAIGLITIGYAGGLWKTYRVSWRAFRRSRNEQLAEAFSAKVLLRLCAVLLMALAVAFVIARAKLGQGDPYEVYGWALCVVAGVLGLAVYVNEKKEERHLWQSWSVIALALFAVGATAIYEGYIARHYGPWPWRITKVVVALLLFIGLVRMKPWRAKPRHLWDWMALCGLGLLALLVVYTAAFYLMHR